MGDRTYKISSIGSGLGLVAGIGCGGKGAGSISVHNLDGVKDVHAMFHTYEKSGDREGLAAGGGGNGGSAC